MTLARRLPICVPVPSTQSGQLKWNEYRNSTRERPDHSWEEEEPMSLDPDLLDPNTPTSPREGRGRNHWSNSR